MSGAASADIKDRASDGAPILYIAMTLQSSANSANAEKRAALRKIYVDIIKWNQLYLTRWTIMQIEFEDELIINIEFSPTISVPC